MGLGELLDTRLRRKVMKHFRDDLGSDDDAAKKRLRFVSVLLDFVPYNATVVKNALIDARTKKNRLSRRLKSSDVWMRGAHRSEAT